MSVPYSTGIMLDLVAQIQAVASDIQAVRTGRGLKQLVCPANFPTFPILVGEEWAGREHSPPRIIFIPQGITTEPAIVVGRQPMAGQVGQQIPRPFTVAGSTSRRSYGATSISRSRIHSKTSTRRRRCTASSAALSCASAAVSQTFAWARLDGRSPLSTSDTADYSSCRSRSPRTSPMSRSWSSRSQALSLRSQARASRSQSQPRSTGPMARARRSEPTTFPEVA